MQIEPKFWRRFQGLREQPRGRRCDASLPPDQFVDSLDGNPEVLGQRDLGHSERCQELFLEHFARVTWRSMSWDHCPTPRLVVVDQPDFVCVRANPAKNETPLVVHTHAVKTSEISAQKLEAVAGWGTQVPKRAGRIDHVELPRRNADHEIVYQEQKDAEIEAFADFLRTIVDHYGPQTSRYSAKRIFVRIEPGDKYEPPE